MVCPTSPHLMDMEMVFNHVLQGILWEDDGVRGPLFKAARFLYDRSSSFIHIASSKSDLFPVHVHFSLVLFITFMDRILDATIGQRGSGEGTTGFHRCFLQIMLHFGSGAGTAVVCSMLFQ